VSTPASEITTVELVDLLVDLLVELIVMGATFYASGDR